VTAPSKREPDLAYFSRRAQQEAAAAKLAQNKEAGLIHRQLASRYALIAASIAEVRDQLGSYD
jgi:hypothetical protein